MPSLVAILNECYCPDFVNPSEIRFSTQCILADIPAGDCVPTIRCHKSTVADYMYDTTSKPETLGDVIDQIERMRDELFAIQKVLEKMEVAEPFGEQDAARIEKTEDDREL
jgi:hypothetical protein